MIKKLPEKYDHRYYLGRHKIAILKRCKRKALIMHLEKGYVGNTDLGYKKVDIGDMDICMIRRCELKKRIRCE